MSEQIIALNNGNQAIIHTDLSRLFVGENRYEKGTVNNTDLYDPVTYPAGTLMGRISASGILVPLTSGAANGSQYPVGVLADDVTVEESDTAVAYVCVAGDVIASKIILQGADTLETVISGRRIRDRIAGDTVGIKLVNENTEHSDFDND